MNHAGIALVRHRHTRRAQAVGVRDAFIVQRVEFGCHHEGRWKAPQVGGAQAGKHTGWPRQLRDAS